MDGTSASAGVRAGTTSNSRINAAIGSRPATSTGPSRRPLARGLTRTSATYEAQVEWGFSRKTLTFTRQRTLDAPDGGGLRLPGRSKSTAIAAEKIPGKLDRVG